MLDLYKDKQSLFYEEVTNFIKNDKISHAYIVETNSYPEKDELILAFIKSLFCSNHYFNDGECNDCNICHLIDQNIFSDLVIIEPDGSWIKKEQIAMIKETFKTTSLDNGYRIYLIKQADRMNKYAANSLLKFLEEPDGKVIAILEVENRYKLLETIRSRCQVLSLKNSDAKISIDDIEFLNRFISLVEKKKLHSLAYLPQLLEYDYHNRNFWVSFFYQMMEIYETSLRKKEKLDYYDYGEILDVIISSNQLSDIIYKIRVLFEIIQSLDYNLNMQMMLDSFIIQFMGGC